MRNQMSRVNEHAGTHTKKKKKRIMCRRTVTVWDTRTVYDLHERVSKEEKKKMAKKWRIIPVRYRYRRYILMYTERNGLKI